MTDRLLFLLGPSTDAALRWGRVDGARVIDGGRLENAAGLSTLVDEGQGSETVIALLPGEQVAVRRAGMLPRARQKGRAAATYLMEDELGEAADGLHIAIVSKAETQLVMAVRSSVVEAWLAAFSSAGIVLDTLAPDYLALTPTGDGARVLFEQDRAIAAFEGVGVALERGLFETIAANLFKTTPAWIEGLGDASLRSLLPAESEIRWLGDCDDRNVLSFYGSALEHAPAANLLQGRFTRRRAVAPILRPWRRAALIAAGAASLFCMGLVADGVRAENTAREWTRAAQALHSATFPEKATMDGVEHARRLLAQGSAGSSFLALVTKFGEAVEKSDEIAIDRIRYNASNGEFSASISSASDAGIEEFKTTLSKLGVETQDRGGYRRTGERWSGELSARLK